MLPKVEWLFRFNNYLNKIKSMNNNKLIFIEQHFRLDSHDLKTIKNCRGKNTLDNITMITETHKNK